MGSRKIASGYEIEVSGKRYPVPSIEAASALICKARDRFHLRASQYDPAHIYDGAGKLVGYVAYNGKVMPGSLKDWSSTTKPLFDPRDALPL